MNQVAIVREERTHPISVLKTPVVIFLSVCYSVKEKQKLKEIRKVENSVLDTKKSYGFMDAHPQQSYI